MGVEGGGCWCICLGGGGMRHRVTAMQTPDCAVSLRGVRLTMWPRLAWRRGGRREPSSCRGRCACKPKALLMWQVQGGLGRGLSTN